MDELNDPIRFNNHPSIKGFLLMWADAIGREVADSEKGRPSLALERCIARELLDQ
jgi:hypothetical protein